LAPPCRSAREPPRHDDEIALWRRCADGRLSGGAVDRYAEINEHFCLELANGLELGVVPSRMRTFAGEIAIVVERFDRIKQGRAYTRIHQEDVCQALAVMPTRKYEREGGPGIADIISVLRDASLDPTEDIERFIQATALNWVIAATDVHAKNYALLHAAGGGVRLAPFYDILSYLPYADSALHRVKLAMKIDNKYLVSRVNRSSWESLATANGLAIKKVMNDVDSVLERLPKVADRVAGESIDSGLDPSVVEDLRDRVLQRTRDCANIIAIA
jgi:serine/threonine-protein kinase HipA